MPEYIPQVRPPYEMFREAIRQSATARVQPWVSLSEALKNIGTGYFAGVEQKREREREVATEKRKQEAATKREWAALLATGRFNISKNIPPGTPLTPESFAEYVTFREVPEIVLYDEEGRPIAKVPKGARAAPGAGRKPATEAIKTEQDRIIAQAEDDARAQAQQAVAALGFAPRPEAANKARAEAFRTNFEQLLRVRLPQMSDADRAALVEKRFAAPVAAPARPQAAQPPAGIGIAAPPPLQLDPKVRMRVIDLRNKGVPDNIISRFLADPKFQLTPQQIQALMAP